MVLVMVGALLMWQTFRFKFTTKGAVLSVLYVIVASTLDFRVIPIATMTALIAGCYTIVINYIKQVVEVIHKYTNKKKA